MEDFSATNSAFVTMSNLCLPARVCVETVLPEELIFPIDCLVNQSSIKIGDGLCQPKEILYVQIISPWAPASIGSCSQSIKVNEHAQGALVSVPID